MECIPGDEASWYEFVKCGWKAIRGDIGKREKTFRNEGRPAGRRGEKRGESWLKCEEEYRGSGKGDQEEDG